MNRIPTNFGSYEIDERQAVPWPRRWLVQVREVVVTTVVVVLAGLFVFPAKAFDVVSARGGLDQNAATLVCPQESSR